MFCTVLELRKQKQSVCDSGQTEPRENARMPCDSGAGGAAAVRTATRAGAVPYRIDRGRQPEVRSPPAQGEGSVAARGDDGTLCKGAGPLATNVAGHPTLAQPIYSPYYISSPCGFAHLASGSSCAAAPRCCIIALLFSETGIHPESYRHYDAR